MSRRRISCPDNRHRPLGLETLETRDLLAADWQNPTQRFDVNNDRRISAFDVLLGISRLNTQTTVNLGVRDPNSTEPFYDVNGDGKHTAFDVLQGINVLNLGRPIVAAGLVRDTAPLGFNLDRLTSDPLIEGNVTFVKPAMRLLAWLDAPTTAPATDLTASLVAGKFTLDQAALEAILGGPLADGPHTLHLQTVIGAEPATSAIDLSFVLDRQPSAPFAITGPTGARNNPAQTIAWEASTGATLYELQITRQADGTDVVATFTTTGTTQAYTYPADGTYYTRVRAFDAAGNVRLTSNQSLPVSIDTVPPGPFQIANPTDIVTTSTPVASWTAATGAVGYDVAIAIDAACISTVQTHLSITGTSVALSALSDGHYFTCVDAYDAAGNIRAATNDGRPFEVDAVTPLQHLVFVSSFTSSLTSDTGYPTDFPSFGGLNAADWNCNLAAANAGLFDEWDGEELAWKAILSGPGINAKDRIDIQGPVYNMNGQLVASSEADFWDGSHSAAISVTELGGVVSAASAGVWTATTSLGLYSGQSCNGWVSQTGNADIGNALATNNFWSVDNIRSCSSSARLYCISPAQP